MTERPDIPGPESEDLPVKGLVRETLAGQGHTLAAAFDKVDESENVVWSVADADRHRLGVRLASQGKPDAGHWDVFRFSDEFYTVSSDLTLENPHEEFLPGDGMLEFHVRLSGELTLMTSRSNPLRVSGPSLLVWSLPEGQDTQETIPAQHETSVTIYFEPTHVLRHYIGDSRQMPLNLARFMLDRSDSVNYCTLPINPAIIDAATSICKAGDQFEGLLWLNYVHAKSVELICRIVSAFDELSDAAQVTFTEREVDQLRKARQIALEELERPPTIKEVARRIGSNETKLKQGFRAMYGETLFEYRNRKRMAKAMELVTSGESLLRVSERVGFKHQTSFTTAFKSHFGVSPKDCRKR